MAPSNTTVGERMQKNKNTHGLIGEVNKQGRKWWQFEAPDDDQHTVIRLAPVVMTWTELGQNRGQSGRRNKPDIGNVIITYLRHDHTDLWRCGREAPRG